MKQRYQLPSDYEQLFGCSLDEASEYIRQDRYKELIKRIMEKFQALTQQYDMILCVGSDYRSAGAVLEFDFNIDLANNLGCWIIPVVCGMGRETRELLMASDAFHKMLKENNADVLQTVINRVDESKLAGLQESFKNYEHPMCFVPNVASLGHASVLDVWRGLGAEALFVNEQTLAHEISSYKIVTMQTQQLLEQLSTGCLLIVSGDRVDVLLAVLASYQSRQGGKVAGLLLTEGVKPDGAVQELLEGMDVLPFAVLSVNLDTYNAAMKVNALEVEITADNERKINTALGVVESHMDLPGLILRIGALKSQRRTPLMFESEMVQRARQSPQHIVLPEGEEERILRAAERLVLREVCRITLLGNVEVIKEKIRVLDLQLEQVDIIDPASASQRAEYAKTYYELRKHKGISEQMAFDTLEDVSYFGTMMVYHDHADGMVSGSVHTTQHTIRPAFETIKTAPGAKIVSSVFFMCLEDRVLVYGDCAINPNPNVEQLADIAISSANTAQQFGITPVVAMLSYSSGKSGKGADVDVVREATQLVKQQRPDLLVEGPIQYDAAVDPKVAKTKLPDSAVAGKASVFVFPDLNTGNNTYKAVQRSSGAVAIGPVLQGLKKPVNDLSRGCTVVDIVNTVVITAIQAQGVDKQ